MAAGCAACISLSHWASGWTRRALKRAGMDYWADLDVTTYIDFKDFQKKNPDTRLYMATTKAPKVYTEVHYEPDCYIMFGKESAGIPEEILVEHQEDLCAESLWTVPYPFTEPGEFRSGYSYMRLCVRTDSPV